MIKGTTKKGDLILGLSEENIRRLRSGQPIAFKFDEVFPGMKGGLYIVYGKTEQDIVKYLPIGPETKIRT